MKTRKQQISEIRKRIDKIIRDYPGGDFRPQYAEDVLTSLLADLHHWADQYLHVDFEFCVEEAARAWERENVEVIAEMNAEK